jgi:hypothetical protein
MGIESVAEWAVRSPLGESPVGRNEFCAGVGTIGAGVAAGNYGGLSLVIRIGQTRTQTRAPARSLESIRQFVGGCEVLRWTHEVSLASGPARALATVVLRVQKSPDLG